MNRNLFTGLALVGALALPLSLSAAVPKAAKPYLGIGVEARSKDADSSGVVLNEVNPDGPAGKAGLKKSDRIVMADGKEVKTFKDLTKALATHKPGDKIEFKVMRDGKEQTLSVTLGERPGHFGIVTPPVYQARVFLGVQSQPLTAELKEHLGLKTDKGALVTRVMPDSPAARAGLKEEDVITQVDKAVVNSPEDLRDAVGKVAAGKEVVLKVLRGKEEMELKAKLAEAPASADLRDGQFELPDGFGRFPGNPMPLFRDMDKVPALEKKIQELEKRVRELEQKLKK